MATTAARVEYGTRLDREPARVGDVVWFWFHTGAFGITPCKGEVIQAGPKQIRVRWESGIENRLRRERWHEIFHGDPDNEDAR